MSVLAPTASRTALASLAPLFDWPDDGLATHAARATEDVAQADRQAARDVREFAREMDALGRAQREITYTSTFDLAPSCSPYLGVHLFGEENRARAALMTGLRSIATTAHSDRPSELPDHIAVVLTLAPHFKDDEWADLLRLVLEPALVRMEKALDGSHNPYRRLLSTARRLARNAAKEGENS